MDINFYFSGQSMDINQSPTSISSAKAISKCKTILLLFSQKKFTKSKQLKKNIIKNKVSSDISQHVNKRSQII